MHPMVPAGRKALMYTTNPIIGLISIILEFYKYVVIAAVVASWLIAFNVINTHNNLVASIVRALYAMTEPVFRPIRSILPAMGGLDLSPIIVFFIIIWLQAYVLPWLVIHLGLY